MTSVVVAAMAGLFGLAIGSFLDVVAFRVPRGLSLVRPASFCPACDASLAWFENLPVVSWLALRGRCRRCGSAIPARAVLVEAGTAAAFVGVALGLHDVAAVPGGCVAAATTFALAAMAADDQPLSGTVVLSGTGLAGATMLVAAPWVGWSHVVAAAAGVGIAGSACWVGAVALSHHLDTVPVDRQHASRLRRAGAGPPTGRLVGAIDGLGAAIPAGALLGWLGPVPAGTGAGGAAVAVALMVCWSAVPGRGGTGDGPGAGRQVVAASVVVGVLTALVVAGVRATG